MRHLAAVVAAMMVSTASAPSHEIVEVMPGCLSAWRELPVPEPAGRYVMTYEAKIAAPVGLVRIVAANGKPVATLQSGDDRVWTCDWPTRPSPGSPPDS